MSIPKVSLIAFIIILTSCIIFAEEKKESVEPIIITSQSLINDSKAKTATFEGNVVAKKGQTTFYASKVIVYYEDEQGGDIKMIEAIGNVKLVKADRVITSHKATYYPEPEEIVIFTGEPRATEGKNLVTGEKITYFMKDEKTIVEKSKVYLKERKIQK